MVKAQRNGIWVFCKLKINFIFLAKYSKILQESKKVKQKGEKKFFEGSQKYFRGGYKQIPLSCTCSRKYHLNSISLYNILSQITEIDFQDTWYHLRDSCLEHNSFRDKKTILEHKSSGRKLQIDEIEPSPGVTSQVSGIGLHG